MNLPRVSYPLTIFAKASSQMLKQARKMPLIIYNIYIYIYIYIYIFLFKEKAICTSEFHQRLGQISAKPRSLKNIFHSLHGKLLILQDLILALKADNAEACFVLSGISFLNFGPKLNIVSVPKSAVFMFLLTKCIPLLKLKLSFS